MEEEGIGEGTEGGRRIKTKYIDIYVRKCNNEIHYLVCKLKTFKEKFSHNECLKIAKAII